jgi:hypothetical protein
MLRLGLTALALAIPALSQGFTFTIGNPVASQEFQFKVASFVFRTEGCVEPVKPQISATAEGIVNGQRRPPVALKVMAGSKPGIYAVYQSWPAEGHWVVNLKGVCANQSAGAIVPVGPKGFIREATKVFPRPVTESEIEASLTALAQGGRK